VHNEELHDEYTLIKDETGGLCVIHGAYKKHQVLAGKTEKKTTSMTQAKIRG
jgi:hypothetical protein